MPQLPQGLNGIREITPENTIIDVGTLFKNGLLSALRGGSADPVGDATEDAIQMGATRGGADFNLNREMKQIDVDGRRLGIKGFARCVGMNPTLTVSLIEHTVSNIAAYMGSVDIDPRASFDEITPRITIADGDYFDNLMLVGLDGNGDFVVIVMENVFCMSSTALPFKDKDEVTVSCEFTAHALPSAPNDVPVHIFKKPSSGS